MLVAVALLPALVGFARLATEQETERENDAPRSMGRLPAERPPHGRTADERLPSAPSPDQMLADLVYLRLAVSPLLAGARFRVEAEAGTMILAGTVATETVRRRAVRIVLWTPGVLGIRNHLTVNPMLVPSLIPQIEDSVLAKRIALRLATNLFTRPHAGPERVFGSVVEGPEWGFDVEVDNGMVTLAGTVPGFADIRRAVQGARSVPGVRSVRSRLSISAKHAEFAPPFHSYGLFPPEPVTRPTW
jgi:hypothetical protein